MSRIPTPSPSKKPAAVLALHKVAGVYRYVIAGAAGGTLRVTDSGSISATDPKALETLRSKAGSSAAFAQVISPESTIVRSAPPKLVLDGSPEQVASALALVAEAELPSTIPAHRRAAGVFRAGPAHAVYAVGWLGPDGIIAAEATPVPALAALASLYKLTGAADGLAVYCDQPSGVIAMIGAGKGESPRLMLRQLRDDPSDTEAFTAVRDEALTDAAADLEVDAPLPVGQSLRLPRRIPASLGITGDEKISDFALALGAAAFVLEAKPDEQPLLRMLDRSPTAGRTIVHKIADGLSTPRAAAVAAAVCATVLLGGWILAAPAKLAILQSRLGNDSGDYTKAVQQHDWYKALRDRRWPMTALIAELTSGAPEGVRIETLSIEQSRSVNITGTAESAASIEKWCNTLRGKIFTGVVPAVPDESAAVVRFSIKADVNDAMLAAVSELKPVVVSEQPRTKTDSGSRTDRSSGRTNGRANNGGGTSGGRTTTPAASPTAAAEPPPAMTDAQIDKLSAGPATIEWAKRKGQLSRSDLDNTTRSRLQHELERIEARRKALGGGQ